MDGEGARADELGSVFRLVYRSRSRVAADHREVDLAAILGTARTNNARLGVTGALLVWRDAFVQVLEGGEDAVRGLYATIRGDPRQGTLLDLMRDHARTPHRAG